MSPPVSRNYTCKMPKKSNGDYYPYYYGLRLVCNRKLEDGRCNEFSQTAKKDTRTIEFLGNALPKRKEDANGKVYYYRRTGSGSIISSVFWKVSANRNDWVPGPLPS